MKTVCCNCLLTCLSPRSPLGPQAQTEARHGYQHSLSSYCTAGPVQAVGATVPASHTGLPPDKEAGPDIPPELQVPHFGWEGPCLVLQLASPDLALAILTFCGPPTTMLALLQTLAQSVPSHPPRPFREVPPDLSPILCVIFCSYYPLSDITLSSWFSFSLPYSAVSSLRAGPYSCLALCCIPRTVHVRHILGAQ